MNRPTFSVIIPTLNEEKFLPKLLDSLVTQTNKDFEVIVVDGGSTDKTVLIAQLYRNKLSTLLTFQTNKANVSLQRNTGAKQAMGEWFLFIDADSVLLPYAIERIAVYVREKKPTIFSTWFCPDSDTTNDALFTLFANMIPEGSILLHRPVAPGPLTGVSKKAFNSVAGYNEKILWGEDYDLTKRICQNGYTLLILKETLFIHSLRRLRHQGTLKLAQTYAKAVFSVLLTNKTPSYMPGYVQGGHPYTKKQSVIRQSTAKRFQSKLSALLRELFE